MSALLERFNGLAAARRKALGPPVLLSSYVILLGLSCYLAARLGLRFQFHDSQIGVVWPANAIFLSALILTPRARWWLVLLTTALAHVAAMAPLVPVWRLLWQIAGNWAFAIATVGVLARFAGLPLLFETRRQVLAYTAISFVMPAVFGLTTAAFIRSLFHLESVITPVFALLRTMLSNTTALLLVTPVVLLWAQFGFRRLRELQRTQLCEAGALVISLLAVGMLALGAGPEIARLPWLLLWVFPPLLWASVRFGPIGAATSLFFVAALSMWGASRELGPFVLGAGADQVLSLQLFWIILCPPLTLLAASIRERELTEQALQAQRNQLAHLMRVATAGEFSSAVAHELRQPLASILMNTQTAITLLAQPTTNLDELRVILTDIVQENKQAADIISHLQSFVRKDKSRFEALALARVVRNALALGNNVIAFSGVRVRTQIAGELPRVYGDPVQLLQVVLNLIVNACESMNSIPKPDRHLLLQLKQAGHHHLELSVSDRGMGLPVSSKERVFEPFFTTKEKGLGLGLAISRSLAAAHGGRLWGENSPDGGATFHLELPTEISSEPADWPDGAIVRNGKPREPHSPRPQLQGVTSKISECPRPVA